MARRAFTCESKAHEKERLTPRTFVEADRPEGYVPKCPDCGAAMKPQPNREYGGGKA